MDKEIKRCYHYMDLKYDSTIDEIKSRQKIMIKIFRAKSINSGKSYKNQTRRNVYAQK